MALIDSLLTAIIRADGDALVMHVGEKPFVVSPAGNVELSERALTLDAMQGMVSQLLSRPQQQMLDADGAIEHTLAWPSEDEARFALVAARGGDDIWMEIRRHRPVQQRALELEPAAGETSATDGAAARPWISADTAPGVVVPLTRTAPRAEAPPMAAAPPGLERLLRIAASRGASALYLTVDARPLLRLFGEIVPIDGEPPLQASDVEAFLLDMTPDVGRDPRRGQVAEWMTEVPDVGTVRCVSFRDHRGPGAIFRLLGTRALSADQLGLTREIQALCDNIDGLVLVAGRRGSGKSTLMTALVDLVNRARPDHIITLEQQIATRHENRRALISQREVRGGAAEMASAIESALREDPDLLVVDDIASAEVARLVVDAADAGHVVIAGIAAPSTVKAVGRLLEHWPEERRAAGRQALARLLRGAVAQVLLRKSGGGRLAARELLLNTPSVARLIQDDQLQQLSLALERGRRHGMVPFNDALAAFVQSGAIEAREAYRNADDREGLLTQLKRAGIDTSFVDRPA